MGCEDGTRQRCYEKCNDTILYIPRAAFHNCFPLPAKIYTRAYVSWQPFKQYHLPPFSNLFTTIDISHVMTTSDFTDRISFFTCVRLLFSSSASKILYTAQKTQPLQILDRIAAHNKDSKSNPISYQDYEKLLRTLTF